MIPTIHETILIVEDEDEILELMRFHLEKEGYRVLCAQRGSTALSLIDKENIDLAILDVMLPELLGTEICRYIRSKENTDNLPVLFVTARSQEQDELRGFQSGGDDYLAKPFSFKVLIARVEALLKRTRGKRFRYTLGQFEIDYQRHSLKINNERIQLTSREFAILAHLVRQKHRTLSRNTLLDRCWGEESSSSPRSVDVVITRLRPKLGEYQKHLRTVTGYGYQWDEEL